MLKLLQIRMPEGKRWCVVLEAEQRETLLGLLEGQYPAKESNRFVLLLVEATLPRAILQNMPPVALGETGRAY